MIFIDTGAFCAFSDRSDTYHVIAVRQFARVLRDLRPLVTTNFIIDETYTWIRCRQGHQRALEFLQRIREAVRGKPRLDIVTVTRPLEEKAWQLLEKFAEQDLSYTDATSFAVIQDRKLSQAFTFDRHFYLLRVELLPGVVP